METLTNTKLANITDEGLFERVATAVLRLVPEYEGLAHAGINADGKTRKSPVDGLGFSGENGSRMILAQHTITAAAGLERKWLLDPANVQPRQGSKAKPTAPGDVVKSLQIFRDERAANPSLAATLILTTNSEPDESLLRKVTAKARAENTTIDFWTRSRIAARLDTDPRGQVIRRKLLGIEEELLSRDLIADLSTKSLTIFEAGDNHANRVPRALDSRLSLNLGCITFLAAISGSGKTVAAHKALCRHIEGGGAAFVISHTAIEQALTLEQAVMATLTQLQPCLSPAQNPFSFFSDEDPLLLLIEDVNRSTQPQMLVERIAGWTPKKSETSRPHWRILCPVWPHLLGGIRSQIRERITSMTLYPEPLSHNEATNAVVNYANAAGIALGLDKAGLIASALGDDPLLIALNHDWSAPAASLVIERFIEDALARVQFESQQVAAESRKALIDLAAAMLENRSQDLRWNDVLDWNLTSETKAHLRKIAGHAEVLRFEGSSADTKLRFRHDRVRDWLLVEAALALEEKGILNKTVIADPALAEIIGAVLIRAEASKDLTRRVEELGPLALFHGLRVAPSNGAAATKLAAAAKEWICDSHNHGPDNVTLRWQAMVAISDVVGDFMVDLVASFPDASPVSMIAQLRNGDVQGGIKLLAKRELHEVVHWTARPLEAAWPRYSERMTKELIQLIDADDGKNDKQRSALIEFAGVLGRSIFADSLKRLWTRDPDRESRLAIYLWAMARCATPSTAADLLDPVCSIWGVLLNVAEDNMPSPRDQLAAHSIRWGFERAVPTGAIDYFIQRSSKPDLAWQIEYMLHGVDHPDLVRFQTERGTERLRKGNDSYTFNNHAREHWRRTNEGYGTPMSADARAPLLDLWRNMDADEHSRKAGFDMWATGQCATDIAILRKVENDPILDERLLRERLRRGDTLAIPKLVARLDSENGMWWWYYARFVWSASMFEALDRALAREAENPLPNEDRQYDIGSTLTRVVMRLPVPDAKLLLLRYWPMFGTMMHFVQAALYVGTPELLACADKTIRAHADPSKLFTHFTMHFGIHTTDEKGISNESQIRALAPYLGYLKPEDIRDIADDCNEHGWYELRCELIDPGMDEMLIGSTNQFRRTLGEKLSKGHFGSIDHAIDRLREAGVLWRPLAETLQEWLAGQPSVKALRLADLAIRHAGERDDSGILAIWPGDDKELLNALIVDLKFALHRRSRI